MLSTHAAHGSRSPRPTPLGIARRVCCGAVMVVGFLGFTATGCDFGGLMCSPYRCVGESSCTNYTAAACPINDGCNVAAECFCTLEGACTDAQISACAAAVTQTACSSTKGCGWAPVCTGNLKPCSEYSASDCEDRPYCSKQRDCD